MKYDATVTYDGKRVVEIAERPTLKAEDGVHICIKGTVRGSAWTVFVTADNIQDAADDALKMVSDYRQFKGITNDE